MKPVQDITRRRALVGSLALGAAGLLSGCGDRTREAAHEDRDEDRDTDVLVIGAGIAGLAAARSVIQAGLRCVVLEARDRIGGRIWTSEAWPDLPIDLGASWMHGTEGNPVYQESTRLGIPSAVFDVGSFEGRGSAEYYSANGTGLDADEIDGRVSRVLAALERDAGRAEAGRTSLQAALDALPSGLAAEARAPEVAAALTDYAGDFGATVQTLALSALDEDDSFPGAQRVFPGGMGQLVRQLADGLDVRTGTRATVVSLRDPGQVVVDSTGGQWRAAKVIVTVPLGVLKSAALRFDPPLPAAHAAAIERLGMGRFEKLVLRFDTAFWDDVDQIQVLDRPGEPFTGWYNLHRVTGQPVLMALNGGAAAAAVGDLPQSRKTALATDRLAAVYRDRFRPPLDDQATDWWGDEFSRGSYSFTAVGSGEADREALAEPVGDRLWLAGEAQHPSLHSTVHGAWLSGRTAAEQAAG